MRLQCPYCLSSDKTMMEQLAPNEWLCVICSKIFEVNDDKEREGSTDSQSAERKSNDRGSSGRRNRV